MIRAFFSNTSMFLLRRARARAATSFGRVQHWDERGCPRGWTPCPPQASALWTSSAWASLASAREMGRMRPTPWRGRLVKWLCGEGSTSPEMAEPPGRRRRLSMANAKRTNELNPEVAHEWLRKVLDGWVKLISQNLPVRIERELDKLRAKLKQPELQ